MRSTSLIRSLSAVLFAFLLRLPSLHIVNALANVTVDDQDPRITYNPSSSWTRIDGPNMDAGGGHMLAEDDPGATATITFTFVSVYFMSTLWPYHVRDYLSIDEGEPILVDLQDYSRPDVGNGTGTVPSSVVAWYEGTENAEHTIVVSVPPGVQYSVVDMFIFTVLDSPDPTDTAIAPGTATTAVPGFSTVSSTLGDAPTSTTLIGFTTEAHGANPTPSGVGSHSGGNSSILTATKHAPTLRIALGVVGALLALLLLSALWWLRRRRHRNRGDDDYSTIAPVLLPGTIKDPQEDGLDDEGHVNDPDDGRSYRRVSTTDGLASNNHNVMAEPGLGRSQNWDGSSRRGSSAHASSSKPYSETLLGRQPTSSSSIYSVPTRQRGDGLASTAQIIVTNPPTYLANPAGYNPPGADTGAASSGAGSSAPPSAYRKRPGKAETSTTSHSIFGGDAADEP